MHLVLFLLKQMYCRIPFLIERTRVQQSYQVKNYSLKTSNFEHFKKRFFEKNLFDPLVMLWTYYFLEKNPKADELWEKYIKYRHTVPCEEFFYFSHVKNDIQLYLELADVLRQSFIMRKAKLAIYSNLMRNCMKMSKFFSTC